MSNRIVVNPWEKFNHWTFTGVEEVRWEWRRKERYLLCKCDCGKEKRIRLNQLRWNREKRCLSCARTKHGMSRTPFYRKREEMNNRCYQKSSNSYQIYWGRWIIVERKTFDDFKKDMYESYLEHIEKYWRKQTTLDRIDSDWNYCKENCRRATYSEQNVNRKPRKVACLSQIYWSINPATFNIRQR